MCGSSSHPSSPEYHRLSKAARPLRFLNVNTGTVVLFIFVNAIIIPALGFIGRLKNAEISHFKRVLIVAEFFCTISLRHR